MLALEVEFQWEKAKQAIKLFHNSGTVTGNITANILYAGADYQNLSSQWQLMQGIYGDNDGEIIIVINGGFLVLSAYIWITLR